VSAKGTPRAGTTRTYQCPPDHTHGATITCYRHGCGCDGCVEKNRTTADANRRRIAYGRPNARVDPTPALTRLKKIRGEGWTFREIVEATGIPKSSLQRMLRDKPKFLMQSTANRIVTATRPGKAPQARVDATGTRRRLQALVAHGWTLTELADQLDRGLANVAKLATAPGCFEHTRREVADLYDRLWAVEVPDGFGKRRSLTLARQRGWVGALAWDDIDNPRAKPRGAVNRLAA